ncbi:hypothetical protein AB6A40_005072 [Gnathostoma spinigerum]|uniref:Sodium/calcium exchanger membrane region domain-containing protein n=1 Tax=Gnathostoma spinigerum TaxID=75299 RepID=A0ABD6EEI5_9BILA
MAAGGSAPEFFTSLFGVFITQNNVGIGTIVGSATFNILCVLAFCALCSRDILHLTWWPLFRDMFFYIFALLFLVIIFFDEVIEWFEASTMIIIYIIYGIFMKYNGKIEGFVRFKLNMVTSGHKTSPSERTKSPVNANRLPITGERRRSIPVLHSGGLFRESITKLVREQKSNPFFRDNVPCSTASLRRQATLPLTKSPKNNCSQKRLSLQTSNEIKANNTLRGIEQSVRTKSFDASKRKPTISVIHECAIDGLTDRNSSSVICSEMPGAMLETVESTSSKSVSELSSNTKVSKAGVRFDDKSTDELKCRQKILCPDPEPIDGERPVDLSWPSTTMARLTYVILAPVTYTLYCTLPDTKKAERRKLFILTFLGSILWIAFYAYIMVWWAAVIGETLGIPTEIMGLTLLAAGTSIPDLITSVIVARKGLGDMAVSSSIGSNLFDICIGLPVPWVLHALIFWTFHTSDASSSVAVSSKGLICSVGMLFIMLVILVISIAACRWQMDKKFGAIMLFAYIAFCLLSILLENGILLCPLKTNNYSCR